MYKPLSKWPLKCNNGKANEKVNCPNFFVKPVFTFSYKKSEISRVLSVDNKISSRNLRKIQLNKMKFNLCAFGEFDWQKFLWQFPWTFVVIVAVLFMMFAGAQAACGGQICATDLRTQKTQNFRHICAMRIENKHGGSGFDYKQQLVVILNVSIFNFADFQFKKDGNC